MTTTVNVLTIIMMVTIVVGVLWPPAFILTVAATILLLTIVALAVEGRLPRR